MKLEQEEIISGRTYILKDNGPFGIRMFELNPDEKDPEYKWILVGSSTWIQYRAKDSKDDLEYHGWKVLLAESPSFVLNGKMRYGMTFSHAYKPSMTKEEKDFHFYDHNCATSASELHEAIDYWNDCDAKGIKGY
jgi:hypothetical protein